MTMRRGYDADLTGVEDDGVHSVDYDGGLRAVAEGGRIAVLHGHGMAEPTGQHPTGQHPTGQQADKPLSPDIDSPFLGLVGQDNHDGDNRYGDNHDGINGHQEARHLAGGGHVTGAVYAVPAHAIQPVIEPTGQILPPSRNGADDLDGLDDDQNAAALPSSDTLDALAGRTVEPETAWEI